jgi:signal transduction histidine kinase
MPDYYQVPALVLTALLVPAFGYLYFRFRTNRALLWFLAFFLAVVRMVLLSRLGSWDVSDPSHAWLVAIGETSIQLSSALFLGSLSQATFRIGRLKVLCVVPYIIPLLIYSVVFYGVFASRPPKGPSLSVFLVLLLISLFVGIAWSLKARKMPVWLALCISIFAGFSALYLCLRWGVMWPLLLAECGNFLMTALLLILTYRRFSPGMALAVIGFTVWAMPIVLVIPFISNNGPVDLFLTRAFILAKVIAALGMILLALEDELDANRAAQERERRSRHELEAYANLILSRRRLDDFDRQGNEICETIAEHSRFSQTALLLLRESGQYRLAGAAGLEDATIAALNQLAGRIQVEGFLAPGTASPAVEHSQAVRLDLEPWMAPGDDLKRLRFTSALAVPMRGRGAVEGALLLGGLRNPIVPIRADDLLPVEMLAGRLQAVRSHTIMLEKLIDSEKFAGLGQLAGDVTQQLNNPLTVILGYASLLEETPSLDPQEHKGIDAILTEARRMRSTLASLSRISRSQDGKFAAVSIAELLADMELLHSTEFLRRSIEFRLSIAPGLPTVLGHAQQLRQAVLHCVQFAVEAVDSVAKSPDRQRMIRLEASLEGSTVRIVVAHSGPGFLHPDRAFDPFVPAQASGETTGLGLSLCSTILRDHNGRASAVNMGSGGAAIVLELQAAPQETHSLV